MPSHRSSKPATSRRPKAQATSVPGWVWIFGISALLLFVGFLLYLHRVPPSKTVAPLPVTSKSSGKAQTASSKSTPPKHPTVDEQARFKFYEMLPKTQVNVPEVDAYQPPDAVNEEYNYLIQTGSFRTAAEAERQRAIVAFQGLKASIEEVNGSNGEPWYRVQIGPFASRSHMNSAVDKLVAIKIEPLVRKFKVDNSKASH